MTCAVVSSFEAIYWSLVFASADYRNNIIGKGAVLGEGENIPNELKPNIYNTGITVVGENSVIPDGVHIGKNCVIYGKTSVEDYPNGVVASGKSVIKEESRL